MKITVTIYNDDKAGNRDIEVLELGSGKETKRTVIEPGEHGNMEQFEIIGGDLLVVSAAGA